MWHSSSAQLHNISEHIQIFQFKIGTVDDVAWCTTFHLEIKAFLSVLERKLCSSFTVSCDE